MNKFALFSCLSLLTVASVAETIEVTVGSVGVTQITSTLKNTIVAVSFADLEAGGDIKVADLVKTDNLTEGDQLAIFNGGSTYDTWTLLGGAWVKNDKTYTVGANGLVEGEGEAADVTTKAVGTGFWLCRGNNWDGKEFTFYTYGKPVETKTSTIPADTVTLVGNPTQQNVNLNDAGKVEGARFADYIMTIEDGVPQYYMYNGSGWGRNSDSGVVSLPAVAPGHGFWIQTKANATINW